MFEGPNEERKRAMQDILWDRTTLHIYCDASYNLQSNMIGIAAMFLFDGQSQILTRKLNASSQKITGNVFGEIEAVKFAINNIKRFINQPILVYKPESTIIYTDCNVIYDHVQVKEDVCIKFLGDDKKHNPWYTAAHNAARKEIFLRPKSGKRR